MSIIIFIIFLTLILVVFLVASHRKRQQKKNYIKQETDDTQKHIDAFEESCARFKEWKQSTSPEEWKKMLKTGLAVLDKNVYWKHEDIQNYDFQDRMMILSRDLAETQLQEIYPNINDLKSYISGGLFQFKRGELYDYFRNTFKKEELYDWWMFREIMMEPNALANHQQGMSKEAFKYHIKKISDEFNKDIISEDYYEKEIRKLLDSYFPCITIDSDAQLRAKEEYLTQIRTAHQNNAMSDKEFRIQEKLMQLSIALHDE